MQNKYLLLGFGSRPTQIARVSLGVVVSIESIMWREKKESCKIFIFPKEIQLTQLQDIMSNENKHEED